MPQVKKNYKMLNCKLDKEVAEDLERFSSESGLSKTATVENALRAYLTQNKQHNKGTAV